MKTLRRMRKITRKMKKMEIVRVYVWLIESLNIVKHIWSHRDYVNHSQSVAFLVISIPIKCQLIFVFPRPIHKAKVVRQHKSRFRISRKVWKTASRYLNCFANRVRLIEVREFNFLLSRQHQQQPQQRNRFDRKPTLRRDHQNHHRYDHNNLYNTQIIIPAINRNHVTAHVLVDCFHYFVMTLMNKLFVPETINVVWTKAMRIKSKQQQQYDRLHQWVSLLVNTNQSSSNQTNTHS